MRGVLAAINSDACAQPVLGTALALAELFDGTPIALHVGERGMRSPTAEAHAAGIEFREQSGPAADRIVVATEDPEIVALVLGAGAKPGGPFPVGRTAIEVITQVAKPVAVVPAHAQPPARLSRLLVPLEGTPESSRALDDMIKLARRCQLEILVLHVHSPATVPAFSDHEPYATEAWNQEFLARHLQAPHENVKLVRHLGAPARDIVAIASETAADLVMLAWSQQLGEGRAQIISHTLAHASVPVLLVPAPIDRLHRGLRLKTAAP